MKTIERPNGVVFWSGWEYHDFTLIPTRSHGAARVIVDTHLLSGGVTVAMTGPPYRRPVDVELDSEEVMS